MVTDLQTDPLKNELTHADFQVVNMSEELEAEVTSFISSPEISTLIV
jgi:large subunit ribosomal protein L25